LTVIRSLIVATVVPARLCATISARTVAGQRIGSIVALPWSADCITDISESSFRQTLPAGRASGYRLAVGQIAAVLIALFSWAAKQAMLGAQDVMFGVHGAGAMTTVP
jgi:hypothetical protein